MSMNVGDDDDDVSVCVDDDDDDVCVCVACGYCCHSRCMNLISRMCASVKV